MGPATMPPSRWCASRAGSTARAVPRPIRRMSIPSSSEKGCWSASRMWKSARLISGASLSAARTVAVIVAPGRGNSCPATRPRAGPGISGDGCAAAATAPTGT
ncbi:hypothetical protein G6F40_015805 [Rhizopus arrhizus]|nr:hypothetical protein G6F40_015805 [Rhizopus arrhizus]